VKDEVMGPVERKEHLRFVDDRIVELHADQLNRVLDGLESISERADAELKKTAEGRSITEFYLSSISIWDEADQLLQLEFSPLDQPTSDDFVDLEFYWPEDDEFTNHHIKIRPTINQLTKLREGHKS
jgi:hypothetical protein